MLLRHRAPKIETTTFKRASGLEHLDLGMVAVLRWLRESGVEFVLVGGVAEAIRGDARARGPVVIVAAPYRRNYERLSRALWSAHARLRNDVDPGLQGGADTTPVKMTPEKFAHPARWAFRCGSHDLDVEGRTAGTPGYQELLYEAARFALGEGLTVEVASPEDIELYAHVQRTGKAPEIRISRKERVEQGRLGATDG
jgi:hypothetical protein